MLLYPAGSKQIPLILLEAARARRREYRVHLLECAEKDLAPLPERQERGFEPVQKYVSYISRFET